MRQSLLLGPGIVFLVVGLVDLFRDLTALGLILTAIGLVLLVAYAWPVLRRSPPSGTRAHE
ncbi:hypothetical protein [Modestobacter sp. SYSU DS0875]